jgi:hypothetical protein
MRREGKLMLCLGARGCCEMDFAVEMLLGICLCADGVRWEVEKAMGDRL